MSEYDEVVGKLAEAFAEEGADLTKAALADRLTQHGYGKVLATLGQFKDGLSGIPGPVVQAGLLQAMINAGYPRATAAQVAQLTGLPGFGDSQSILMGLE